MLNAHLFGDVEVLILVDDLHELGRDVGVSLRAVFEPFGEGHKNLDGVDDVGLLVELLDDGRELGELVAEAGEECRVAGAVDLSDKGVDGEQELIDELCARDAFGGAYFLPVALDAPFGDGGTGGAYFLGYFLLLHAGEVEGACESALLLSVGACAPPGARRAVLCPRGLLCLALNVCLCHILYTIVVVSVPDAGCRNRSPGALHAKVRRIESRNKKR